jgi:hypothetical protein
MPPRKGVRILPPPRHDAPVADEDWIREHTEHGHICGVGTSHRPGTPEYRQCPCGQWYGWAAGSWQPVSHPGTWRDSRDAADLVNDLFGLAGEGPGARWHMPTAWDFVMAWRRLRLYLRQYGR